MKNSLFAPPPLGTALLFTGLPGGSNQIQNRSSYGNSGIIIGATWVRLSNGLWCLYFDGVDDRVDCGNHSSLHFIASAQMTIKAWVRLSQIDRHHVIVNKRGVNVGYWLRVEGAGGNINKLRFTRADWVDKLTGAKALAANTWYQVGLAYDNNSGQLYLNGVPDGAAGSNMGFVNETAANLKIADANGWSWLKGNVALAEMHNRAWRTLEFQNSFNREKHLFGVW